MQSYLQSVSNPCPYQYKAPAKSRGTYTPDTSWRRNDPKIPSAMEEAIKDKDAKKESIEEGDDKKVQLPSGKEMKKCADKGMSKADIMKKYTEMGCEAKQLEKLYASSCGGH